MSSASMNVPCVRSYALIVASFLRSDVISLTAYTVIFRPLIFRANGGEKTNTLIISEIEISIFITAGQNGAKIFMEVLCMP